MKPPGINLALTEYGMRLAVTPTDRVVDKIWEAVEDAVLAGMHPKKFKYEVLEAWEYHAKQLLDDQLDQMRQGDEN